MSTEEAKTQHYEGSLLVQPDEALPPVQSLLLGLQHLLAMDIYVVPLSLPAFYPYLFRSRPSSFRQPLLPAV